jgi:hypothetical protein
MRKVTGFSSFPESVRKFVRRTIGSWPFIIYVLDEWFVVWMRGVSQSFNLFARVAYKDHAA